MTSEQAHDRVRAKLSEYLDGPLPGAERVELDRHLAGCAPCRQLLLDLRRVTRAARSLGPVEPPRDLWPGVAHRLDARVPRTGGAPVPPSMGRGWLAAAAVLLVALSASLAWWARGAALGSVASETDTASAVRPVSTRANGPISEELAEELGRLESVIALSRERLDAGTVHALERNLLVIERAIEDSYRALALDPENAYVRDHLERTYRRKLDYLREVSSILEIAG